MQPQSAENNSRTKMNRVIKIIFIIAVIVCFADGAARAQHYVGVRAGYGFGSVRFFPKQETKALGGMYSGGVSWKYYTAERVVGAIQVDLEYFQRGYKVLVKEAPDTSYQRTINSIMLPLIWQPHVYFAQRKVRVFLNLGVTLSYNMNGKEKWVSERDGVISENSYEFKTVRDNRFGYGLMGGFGVGVLAKRFEYFVEARYHYGFGDVLKNKQKYPNNAPIQRSPLDNFQISFGVYYRLGKGGIVAPPGKKLAAKMEEAELQRIMRETQEAQGVEVVPATDVPTAGGEIIEQSVTRENGEAVTEQVVEKTQGELNSVNPQTGEIVPDSKIESVEIETEVKPEGGSTVNATEPTE